MRQSKHRLALCGHGICGVDGCTMQTGRPACGGATLFRGIYLVLLVAEWLHSLARFCHTSHDGHNVRDYQKLSTISGIYPCVVGGRCRALDGQ